MKRLLTFTLISLFSTLLMAQETMGQQRSVAHSFGLNYDQLKGWFPSSQEELRENLGRLDVSKGRLEDLLGQEGKSILSFAYVKFKQDTFTGINPKAEGRIVKIRSPRPITFEEFKPLAIDRLRKIAGSFDQQSYIVEPTEIKIAGVDSVYHISQFKIKATNGQEHTIRSRTYLVPRGTYFFQISLVDAPNVVDCSQEFENFINSIKVENK